MGAHELSVVAIVLRPSDRLAPLIEALGRDGFAIQYSGDEVLTASPQRELYLVMYDPTANEGLAGLAEWARLRNPPPGLIAVIDQGAVIDREHAFERGFDDAVLADVSARELARRLRAVYRRLGWHRQTKHQFGVVRLDLEARTALTANGKFQLSAIETEFLHVLIAARGRAMSYDELYVAIWKQPVNRDAQLNVQTVIKRLRQKFGRADAIETIRGVGVRLALE